MNQKNIVEILEKNGFQIYCKAPCYRDPKISIYCLRKFIKKGSIIAIVDENGFVNDKPLYSFLMNKN